MTSKAAIFIDAGNLAYMTNRMAVKIDLKSLKQYFITRSRTVVYCGYYTAVQEDEHGNRRLQPLLDFLSANGFHVVSKLTKSYTQVDGTTKTKGNMDIELTCDVMDIRNMVDEIILVTGDGDYEELVRRCVRTAKPVTVVAGKSSGMLSSDLAKVASQVIDLADILEYISRSEPA